MPVHTYKEYDEKSSFKKHLRLTGQEEIEAEGRAETPPAPFYVMLHPENERDNLKEFEDKVIISDKEYKRKCIRGIVRTDQEPLKDYLISQGYLILDIIREK